MIKEALEPQMDYWHAAYLVAIYVEEKTYAFLFFFSLPRTFLSNAFFIGCGGILFCCISTIHHLKLHMFAKKHQPMISFLKICAYKK